MKYYSLSIACMLRVGTVYEGRFNVEINILSYNKYDL